jgi:hypothetical protein
MKKYILVLSSLILCIIKTQAQGDPAADTVNYWKTKVNAGLNLNQAAFSSNWKAGGINSIGLNALFNLKANYKKGRNSWDNEIDFLYGFVNSEGQGHRKTLDRVMLDTKYGYSINKNWDIFTSLNFLTQFAPGYTYSDTSDAHTLISDVFAPAFLTSAWGAEYHPVEYFKVRLSPFAPRITFVHDVERFVTPTNPTPYGVVPPDNVRYEWLAFQLYAEFNKDVATNLNLKWRYVMFANYESLALKTIDHRLDLNLMAKVNKYINVGVGGIMIYDYDQDHDVQLSQLLTIGILYSFQNYVDEKK